jgi:ArsR family transcriptional regulator
MMSKLILSATPADQADIFERAAELFSVLSTPMRLHILNALAAQPKSVTELLTEIETTQPNLSQHLGVLYRSGILNRRKDGAQVIYSVQSQKAMALCRSVCTQIAIEIDEPGSVSSDQRLSTRAQQGK